MSSEKKRSLIGIAVFLAGLLLINLGIYRDEVSAVYLKAINICMECIGIG